MSQKVNLKTIANDLNLSPGTVSRVLNGKARQFRISDETVALVLQYVKEKQYSPNLIARGLQASKTYTIGLMIPDISNPFFALMARNIEKAASLANYSILLVDAEEDSDKEQVQLKNMKSRNVDGIIAAPVGIGYDHFAEINRLGTPLIFVDRYFTNLPIPYITSDNYLGGMLATQYFIDKGHTQIALIKGDELIEPVKERRKGYEKALQNAGIKVNSSWVLGDAFNIENGYRCATQLLTMDQKPSAIFAMSNLIGLGVLQAVKELQLRIPFDLSLVVFDDQPYVSYLNPPITTIKQDSEKIGALAMDYILQKMENPTTTLTSQKISVQLMERESVRPLK